jgi:hypothetical protein
MMPTRRAMMGMMAGLSAGPGLFAAEAATARSPRGRTVMGRLVFRSRRPA